MSQTFCLICNETKKKIWIGQGWSKMTSFYSSDPEVIKSLICFLNDHIKKNIKFVCIDIEEEICEYDDY